MEFYCRRTRQGPGFSQVGMDGMVARIYGDASKGFFFGPYLGLNPFAVLFSSR